MRARFLLVKKCVMNGVFSAMTPGSRRARGGLPRSRRWLKKPFWTAHERIAAFKKTKQLVGSPRDADAHGFADGTHGMVDFAKPKFFIPTKIDAVMAAVDLQRLRETPRAAREIQEFGGFAMPLHDFDSVERLERTNQNGRGGLRALADDVEHEVVAVIEKNVDVAGSEIHRADARRGPAKMMSGGVARRISFGFHDAPADAPCREFVHHYFADQEAR